VGNPRDLHAFLITRKTPSLQRSCVVDFPRARHRIFCLSFSPPPLLVEMRTFPGFGTPSLVVWFCIFIRTGACLPARAREFFPSLPKAVWTQIEPFKERSSSKLFVCARSLFLDFPFFSFEIDHGQVSSSPLSSWSCLRACGRLPTQVPLPFFSSLLLYLMDR